MRIGSLGTPELLVILVIVIILFGVGRISKIGGELGGGIKAFRSSMKDDDEAEEGQEETEQEDKE